MYYTTFLVKRVSAALEHQFLLQGAEVLIYIGNQSEHWGNGHEWESYYFSSCLSITTRLFRENNDLLYNLTKGLRGRGTEWDLQLSKILKFIFQSEKPISCGLFTFHNIQLFFELDLLSSKNRLEIQLPRPLKSSVKFYKKIVIFSK